jgi:hypothetical protein
MPPSSPSTMRSYQFPVLGRSPASSPASFVTTSSSCCTSSSKQKFQDLPDLELLPLAAISSEEENKHSEDDAVTTTSLQTLRAAYDDLVARVDRLRTYVVSKQLEEEARHGRGSSSSQVLKACIETLDVRMPHVLHQTYRMIQDVAVVTPGGHGNGHTTTTSEPSPRFVTDVRSTFALYRAIQYVDRLQEAMDPTTNQGIEEQLETILSGLGVAVAGEAREPPVAHHPAFRLSPWVASDLCFDVPVGQSAYYTIPGDLTVEIESVVEFRAHDPPSVNYARAAAATPVSVTILSCKHVKRQFGLGAGTMGQATITVRLEPTTCSSSSSHQPPQPAVKKVWAVDQAVPALQIKEARAYVFKQYIQYHHANSPYHLYCSYTQRPTERLPAQATSEHRHEHVVCVRRCRCDHYHGRYHLRNDEPCGRAARTAARSTR